MYGVSEICCVDDMILMSISKSNAACMAKTLQDLAQAGVVVDMISQSAPTGDNLHFSFTASNCYFNDVLKCISSNAKSDDSGPMVSGGYAKIYLFGKEMENEAGVAARALLAIGEAGIDVSLVTTSDYDISLLIRQEDVDVAMEKLKSVFAL